MAEQTIMAQVRARLFAEEVGNHTPSKIATDKFLSDNSSSVLYPLAITVNGDAITQSRPLIDAINAISSDQTIKTSITLKAKYHPHAGFKTVNPYNLVIDFTIVIDWENNSVIWTGSRTATRDAPQGKKYNGSAAPSDSLKIEPISGGNAANDWAIVLGTTSARNITRLPIPGLEDSFRQSIINYLFGSWDGYINVDYVITTDSGTTVIVAPTPPPPVVSVKISELPETTSLQDDDLFVLSQDKPDDGNYDISHRVTLANLKASIAGLFAPAITDSDVMSVLQRRDTGFSGTVSLTPPTGKKFAILSCQLDCNASGSGGNWLLVIGKNLDTDLPVGTYPAGTGKSYSADQFDEIYKYSVSETSNTLTDPNGTNTNLRYVYVGDGGTVSMPWRILINNGPSGAVAVTITLVGWA